MRIDELTPEHRDDAAELWGLCGLTRPWNDPGADFARAVAGASSRVLGAVDDGVLVGTVMVGHDGHRGWMYYLAVHPERRRAGLGRRLVAAAERWLADHDVPKVLLMVRESNAEVLAFYESLGYSDQRTVVLGRFFDAGLEAARAAAT